MGFPFRDKEQCHTQYEMAIFLFDIHPRVGAFDIVLARYLVHVSWWDIKTQVLLFVSPRKKTFAWHWGFSSWHWRNGSTQKESAFEKFRPIFQGNQKFSMGKAGNIDCCWGYPKIVSAVGTKIYPIYWIPVDIIVLKNLISVLVNEY